MFSRIALPIHRAAVAAPFAPASARRGMASGVHRAKGFTEVWFGDKGAWPIIIIISGASILCFSASMRYLFKSPDVHFSKTQRQSMLRDNANDAQSFISHKHGFAACKSYHNADTNADYWSTARPSVAAKGAVEK